MKKNIIKFLLCAICFGIAVASNHYAGPSVLEKKHRFLLCMSSFKRPIFISGQVFRFMNQTYQNFDISLSFKGVDESWSRLTFEKEWHQLRKDGRLFLRYDPNRRQLSNLLDTVRDMDLSKYDYFCKIDDDDWYAPEYLENINTELNKIGPADITHTTNTYVLTEDITKTYMNMNGSDMSGATMCFSRKIIEMALEIEQYPERVAEWLPEEPGGLEIAREDRLLHHLARKIGRDKYRRSTEPLVVYGWQYRSVTRNQNYVDVK